MGKREHVLEFLQGLCAPTAIKKSLIVDEYIDISKK